MFAVWEYEADIRRLISSLNFFIRSDGSDIVWKVTPQLCPTEAETAF